MAAGEVLQIVVFAFDAWAARRARKARRRVLPVEFCESLAEVMFGTRGT